MRKCAFLLLIGLAFFSSCIKAPNYPIVPKIEFKSNSSDYVKSGSIDTITFSFTDGDGDIGIISGDSSQCDFCALKHGDSSCFRLTNFNVFLVDSRDTCVTTYASATIPVQGKYKGISGDIEVILPIDSKKCFATPDPNCPLDTVIYTVTLKDQAGHFSNAIKTTQIVVDPH